jgi:predicted DNA repair protein MutK
MSGLIALLDDVAAIAKVAASSLDDVTAQAVKAGSKAAGAVIDDAAVTPKYVHGFPAARELPIVGRIAMGSIRNKLLVLLPAALLLSLFAPWAIAPLLMLGGCYLAYEGAEKIAHAVLHPQESHAAVDETAGLSAAHLEERRVKGAIKTDFILSAEIMTIALAALPAEAGVAGKAAMLALVAVGITALVYGAVAALVKADDAGLAMATHGRLGLTRRAGRAVVKAMPAVLRGLTIVGTAAMLWVGGSILVHGAEELGVAAPAHVIHAVAEAVGGGSGLLEWVVTALLDAILGLAVGLALVPAVARASRLFGTA